MYARTSFRGAKTCKIEKKNVFLVIDKFWKRHDRQIYKKNACKNAYLGSIFIPEKYVIRVLFVSPWTNLIPPLAIRVPPPPPALIVYRKRFLGILVSEQTETSSSIPHRI